jgi:hypothetical protein
MDYRDVDMDVIMPLFEDLQEKVNEAKMECFRALEILRELKEGIERGKIES